MKTSTNIVTYIVFVLLMTACSESGFKQTKNISDFAKSYKDFYENGSTDDIYAMILWNDKETGNSKNSINYIVAGGAGEYNIIELNWIRFGEEEFGFELKIEPVIEPMYWLLWKKIKKGGKFALEGWFLVGADDDGYLYFCGG